MTLFSLQSSRELNENEVDQQEFLSPETLSPSLVRGT